VDRQRHASSTSVRLSGAAVCERLRRSGIGLTSDTYWLLLGGTGKRTSGCARAPPEPGQLRKIPNKRPYAYQRRS
jgi:hypothetical protein